MYQDIIHSSIFKKKMQKREGFWTYNPLAIFFLLMQVFHPCESEEKVTLASARAFSSLSPWALPVPETREQHLF